MRLIDDYARTQFEDAVYSICDTATASKVMVAFDTLPGQGCVVVTKEQLSKIKKRLWSESDDVLGNDMIDICDAFDIVCKEIGVNWDEIG